MCESFEVLTATRGLLKIDHSDFLNDYGACAQTKKSSNGFTPYQSIYVMDEYMEFKDMRNSQDYSKWKYPVHGIEYLSSYKMELLIGRKIVMFLNDLLDVDKVSNILNKCKLKDGYANVQLNEDLSEDFLKLVVEKDNESLNKILLTNNMSGAHWNNYLAINFSQSEVTGDTSKPDIRIYFFDSMYSYGSEVKDKGTLIHGCATHPLTTPFVRYLRFIMMFRFYAKINKMFWDREGRLLKIDKGIMKEMLDTNNHMTIVVVTQQADGNSCGLHSIRCFDAILQSLNSLGTALTSTNFENNLRKNKQLRTYPGECKQFKSELVDYSLNAIFFLSLLHPHQPIDFIKKRQQHDVLGRLETSYTDMHDCFPNKPNLRSAQNLNEHREKDYFLLMQEQVQDYSNALAKTIEKTTHEN